MAAATVLPSNFGQTMKLSKMVDLALGTPEVGAVNFNMLHSMLHALLAKLELQEANGHVMEDSSTQLQPSRGGARDDLESVVTQDSGLESETLTSLSRHHTPYHQLQDRVDILERQISCLNSLPSGRQLVDDFLAGGAGGGDTKEKQEGVAGLASASDLWQAVQMKRKIDSNEEGVGRLGSVVDELMKEMRKLRAENDSLMKQVKELSEMSKVWEKMTALEEKVDSLQDLMNQLKDQLALYPSPDQFANFVTWESLEKALRGIKEQMESLKKPTERIVVNMATDPMSRPQSAASSRGPSEALQEMLENLGQLSDKHDKLDDRVVILETSVVSLTNADTEKKFNHEMDQINYVTRGDLESLKSQLLVQIQKFLSPDSRKEEMPNKADKKDLENLSVPDDLLQRITDMRTQLDNLLSLRNRDNEAMSRIREALSNLQKDMDRLNEVVKKLVEDSSASLSRIEELMNITTDHEGRKADITYVDESVEPKADIQLVNSKVNFNLFDETTGSLQKLIEDLLKKLLLSEEDLRKLLDTLSGDLEGKMDRDEMESLKEWLEKRLRALAAKIKNAPMGGGMTDDDAAGLRKQLLQHFHCISCDRPIDMMPTLPFPSIPERQGMPAMRSMRPYTSFELDAIRQHTKGGRQKTFFVEPAMRRGGGGSEVVDAYQTPRACGGSHTTHNLSKRSARGMAGSQVYEEEPQVHSQQPQPPKYYKEELDLEGVDGHIYKGRLDFLTGQVDGSGRFPNVNQMAGARSQAPVLSDRPKSARVMTPRSPSARQRPLSGRPQQQPPRTESRMDGGEMTEPAPSIHNGSLEDEPVRMEQVAANAN